jgi:FLVCR family feline leukemia virus subgroup C receptor-related protein
VKDQPDKPPSIAQLEIRKTMETDDSQENDFQLFKTSLFSLFKNLNYCLILISYGINTGVYYAIGTLLNQMLVEYYRVIFIQTLLKVFLVSDFINTYDF